MARLTPTECRIAVMASVYGVRPLGIMVNPHVRAVPQWTDPELQRVTDAIRVNGHRLRRYGATGPEASLWATRTMERLNAQVPGASRTVGGMALRLASALRTELRACHHATTRVLDEARRRSASRDTRRRLARTRWRAGQAGERWSDHHRDRDPDAAWRSPGGNEDRETPLALGFDDWAAMITTANEPAVTKLMNGEIKTTARVWQDEAKTLAEAVDAAARAMQLERQLRDAISRSWRECRSAWHEDGTQAMDARIGWDAAHRLDARLQREWTTVEQAIETAPTVGKARQAAREWRQAVALTHEIGYTFGILGGHAPADPADAALARRAQAKRPSRRQKTSNETTESGGAS